MAKSKKKKKKTPTNVVNALPAVNGPELAGNRELAVLSGKLDETSDQLKMIATGIKDCEFTNATTTKIRGEKPLELKIVENSQIAGKSSSTRKSRRSSSVDTFPIFLDEYDPRSKVNLPKLLNKKSQFRKNKYVELENSPENNDDQLLEYSSDFGSETLSEEDTLLKGDYGTDLDDLDSEWEENYTDNKRNDGEEPVSAGILNAKKVSDGPVVNTNLQVDVQPSKTMLATTKELEQLEARRRYKHSTHPRKSGRNAHQVLAKMPEPHLASKNNSDDRENLKGDSGKGPKEDRVLVDGEKTKGEKDGA